MYVLFSLFVFQRETTSAFMYDKHFQKDTRFLKEKNLILKGKLFPPNEKGNRNENGRVVYSFIGDPSGFIDFLCGQRVIYSFTGDPSGFIDLLCRQRKGS